MRPATGIGTLLLVCAACAHGGPGSPGQAPSRPAAPTPTTGAAAAPVPSDAELAARAARLEAIRAEADQVLAAEAKWLWEVWTRGAAPDPGPHRTGHEALFSGETIQLVRSARDGAAGDDRRALSLLHGLLVGERLSQVTAASAEQAANPAAIRWNGHTLSPARARAALAEETDADHRAALERAWSDAERKRERDVDAYWKAVAGAAGQLGYGSLLALAAELRGEPTEALAALAEGALSTTEAAYRALLEVLAQLEMERHLADLRGRDLPRLFRHGDDPGRTPPSHVAREALAALAGLGLDLPRRGVVLDLEPRPGKDPRALAFPVEVPADVRVSFAPTGTPGELRALLHELGAAAFYAHATTRVFEFRRLGSVTAAAWAALFEDLASDPAWLGERTGRAPQDLTRMVCAALARRLHVVRALAARVLVEIARAREPRSARDRAKAILERATARAVDPDELDLFLAEREPLLESADELRAALLAAQARAFVAGDGAKPWWRNEEAGRRLASAFADGSRLDPAALSRALGAPALDAGALDALTRARAEAVGVKLGEPKALACAGASRAR